MRSTNVSGSLLDVTSACSLHPALNCLVSVSPEEYQQIYSSWEMASGISVFGMFGSTTDTVQTYDIVSGTRFGLGIPRSEKSFRP